MEDAQEAIEIISLNSNDDSAGKGNSQEQAKDIIHFGNFSYDVQFASPPESEPLQYGCPPTKQIQEKT